MDGREIRPWPRHTKAGVGYDEFGLVLWALLLMELRSVFLKGIKDCKEGGEARPLLEEIQRLLKSAAVNQKMHLAKSDDVEEFLEAVDELAWNAKEALQEELYDDWGITALDLLDAYLARLRENFFCEIRDYW